MRIFKREPERVAAALFNLASYLGLIKVTAVFSNPMHFYWSYLHFRGPFPVCYRVRTPIGEQTFTLYHAAPFLLRTKYLRDLITRARKTTVIVDIGANIGLAALCFLIRSRDSFLYAFEPVPVNVKRFRQNLRGFENRYVLAEQAVAVRPGTVDFGVEPSGRLGSLAAEARDGSVSSRHYREFIKVSAVEINVMLNAILRKTGHIDVLKIDVEGTEAELLGAIAPDIRSKVRTLHLE
jgi:FkbM family methyltransferase